MAKKKSKSGSKKADRKKEAEKAAAAKKAQRKAEETAKKKAAAKAAALTADAKKARKAADKAVKAAEKAEAKAGATTKADGSSAEKPDELSLAKLALRAAEAKLTATEHRLAQVQQELEGERRLQDEAVQTVLEDAVIDAAVEATVEEAVLEAVLTADVEGDGLDEALVVEAVAIDLEVVADEVDVPDEAGVPAGDASEAFASAFSDALEDLPEVDLPDEAEAHAGDAAEAAEVFEQAGVLDGDAQAPEQDTAAPAAGTEDAPAEQPAAVSPPLPAAPVDGEPSASWTLLQLRTEAKRRGLTGTSNLPKAALLERLLAS